MTLSPKARAFIILGSLGILLLLFVSPHIYPFVFYEQLLYIFAALCILALSIGIVIIFVRRKEKSFKIILEFLSKFFVCIVTMLMLFGMIYIKRSHNEEWASTNVNNQEFHLVYSFACFDVCSDSLYLYKCEFFNTVCFQLGVRVFWSNDYDEISPLIENKEAVSLDYDPTNKTINVLFHGQKRLSFNYP